MNEKKCSKCGVVKPFTEYHKCKQAKLGVKRQCKVCVAEYSKRYGKANKEKRRIYQKQYYEENKEYYKTLNKQYYETNKDTPEYKEKRANYQKKRKEEDPSYKLRHSVSNSILKALKRNKGGKDGQSTFKHLPYTPQQLKEHLEAQFDEHMSWDNYGSYWDLDHIYPQSLLRYDSMDHPNFLKAWDLSNLQPLEKIANIKKGNKIIT